MTKQYTIVPTKRQKEIMDSYWNKFLAEESIFWRKVSDLSEQMGRETGIFDLEFFWCDNECVGIGNSSRTMKLIHKR